VEWHGPLFTQRLDERRGGWTGDYEVTYRKESQNLTNFAHIVKSEDVVGTS